MNTQRYQRVREIFIAAAEMTPERRGAYVAEVCAGDGALAAEVESLLASDGDVDDVLSRPLVCAAELLSGPNGAATGTETSFLTGAPLPNRIGRYQIVRILGVGGMGVVYEARQQEPRRIVALKVINQPVPSDELRRRFEHEVRILGRLQHPGIAQIFEAGTAEAPGGPQPFFAMELVKGAPLTEFAAARRLSLCERVALLIQVCDAVQHAHQQGVIHRDLKPGNVLVDESGRARVLDFGVARATDADAPAMTAQTQASQIIGTLAYMSPEQIAGNGAVDTLSDVHALGVMAYELLAGRLPYEIRGKPIAQAARIITEAPPAPLGAVDSELRGDLDVIVGKALEKDKLRRYRSAGELGADLGRFLRDEPISARAPTAIYQLRKFAKRNKPLVAGVTAAFICLVGGVIATSVGLTRALSAERAAREARDRFAEVARFQESMLGDADPAALGASLRRELIDGLREALRAGGATSREVETAAADLDRALQQANPTSVAVAVLDEQVLARAADALESYSDNPVVEAALRKSLGETYSRLGLPEKSLEQTLRAYELRARHLGPDHIDTLWSMTAVGVTLVDLNRFEEAEQYYRASLTHQRRTLTQDHQDTLTTTGNLGHALARLGRYDEAAELQRQSVAGLTRVSGANHPHTVAAMNGLALSLAGAGRFDEAVACGTEALERYARRADPGDYRVCLLRSNLGWVFFQMGRLAEAEAMLNAAYDCGRRGAGDQHRVTVTAMTRLSRVLTDQGCAADAERLAREAAWRAESISGGGSHLRGLALADLGHALVSLRRFEEADAVLAEAEILLGSAGDRDEVRIPSLARDRAIVAGAP